MGLFNIEQAQIHIKLRRINIMNNLEPFSFVNKDYCDACKINTEEKLHFYYDESNNCRKFSLNPSKFNFNHDYRADFVLAGIATENEFKISFSELRQRFELQKNAIELKSKNMFHGKDFLQCVGMKQVSALINIFSDYDLYIHYSHINNFYYTIVEILDSITSPTEIYYEGFEYFSIKSTFYNMLFPSIDKVVQIMIKFSYPNISSENIENFCIDLLNAVEDKYLQKPDELFISKVLKRASKKAEMIFVQNNTAFVMQEDYSIFYVRPILLFKKSMHHFDEELSIQDKVSKSIMAFNNNADTNNYEFINSKDNTMIQLSDLVAGLLGKMFTFINSVAYETLSKTIKGLNDIQIINCLSINQLRMKSISRNAGLIHSAAPVDIMEKLNIFFELVLNEYIGRI